MAAEGEGHTMWLIHTLLVVIKILSTVAPSLWPDMKVEREHPGLGSL